MVSNDSHWRQVAQDQCVPTLSGFPGRSACRLMNANIGHSKITGHAQSKFIFRFQAEHLTPSSSAFPSAPPLRRDIVKVAGENTRQNLALFVRKSHSDTVCWAVCLQHTVSASNSMAASNWLCSFKTYGKTKQDRCQSSKRTKVDRPQNSRWKGRRQPELPSPAPRKTLSRELDALR